MNFLEKLNSVASASDCRSAVAGIQRYLDGIRQCREEAGEKRSKGLLRLEPSELQELEDTITEINLDFERGAAAVAELQDREKEFAAEEMQALVETAYESGCRAQEAGISSLKEAEELMEKLTELLGKLEGSENEIREANSILKDAGDDRQIELAEEKTAFSSGFHQWRSILQRVVLPGIYIRDRDWDFTHWPKSGAPKFSQTESSIAA